MCVCVCFVVEKENKLQHFLWMSNCSFNLKLCNLSNPFYRYVTRASLFITRSTITLEYDTQYILNIRLSNHLLLKEYFKILLSILFYVIFKPNTCHIFHTPSILQHWWVSLPVQKLFAMMKC